MQKVNYPSKSFDCFHGNGSPLGKRFIFPPVFLLHNLLSAVLAIKSKSMFLSATVIFSSIFRIYIGLREKVVKTYGIVLALCAV